MSWASISTEAEKHQKNKFALVSPKQRGKTKSKFWQSTRDQGQEPAGIRPTKSNQIDPNPTNSVVLGANLAESCPRCCSADFGSRIKISGHPPGRSTSFFEPDLFRWVPGSKNSKKKLRFIPRRFLKGTPVANSYIPYKRLAPI